MRAAPRPAAAASMAALLVGATLAFCLGAPAPEFAAAQSEIEKIAIEGSDTLGAELMPAILDAYFRSKGWTYKLSGPGDGSHSGAALSNGRPVVEVAMERNGSTNGVKGLVEGDVDIAMSSRMIKDDERKKLEADGVDMRGENSEHVVALDGLAIIVSELNPQLTLTPEEVAKIFSGEIADWGDLGQTARPVVVYARDADSGAFDTFDSLALEPFGKKISNKALRYDSNVELARKVAADPNAIGFVPLAFAKNVKTLALSLDCGLIVAPDEFSVKSEEYPLGRRLRLYTKGRPQSQIQQELLAFAKSDEAQALVAQVGFIDQSFALQSAAAFSNHIVGALSLAKNAGEHAILKRLFQFSGDSDRLSLTFRFVSGQSDILDAKSLADAGRLLRWMARNRDARVLLMGFGGDEEEARLRAEAARRAMLIFAEPGFQADKLETYGFGSVAPIACPAKQGEPDRNVRVEVWVAGPKG